MNNDVVKALISIGRAQKILDKVLENPLFDSLSKHNPYWHSEHEVEADLLNDVRMQLQSVSDDLHELRYEMNQDYSSEDE